MNFISRHLGGMPLYAFLLLLLASAVPTLESLPQVESAERGAGLRTLTSAKPPDSSDSVGECILIQLGVLDKGNLGDVIRPVALKRLLASVAPPNQCFWYAHPWVEDTAVRGRYTARFSNGDTSRFVPTSDDYAKEVNQFKALVIGGDGFFSTKYTHALVDIETFSERLTLPVVVMGAAASYHARQCSKILQRAAFVSGRDYASTKVLADVVHRGPASAVMVRDPVLSDTLFTDTEGKCWKRSEGEHQQPICFVLPASNEPSTVEMHRQLVDEVVTPEDVFVNVFPKRRTDNELRDYPGEVQQILDPVEFMERLCSCRAIISTNFNAAVMGLHMGVPTLGASCESPTNEVRELMIDALRLPDQYVVVDERLSRAGLNLRVEAVRRKYTRRGRRASIHDRLSAFHDDFEGHALHVLFGIIGVQQRKGSRPADESVAASSLWPSTSAGADDGPAVKKNTGKRHNNADRSDPSLTAALLTGGRDVSKLLPQDAVAVPSGGLDVPQETIDEAVVARNADPLHASKMGPVSTSTKTGSLLSAEATEVAIASVLISDDYVAAVFLIAAILGITVVLSGGAARQSSSVQLEVSTDDTFSKADGATYVESDGGSRISSDADLTTLPERSFSNRRGRSASATAGVAATSSKIFFMSNFAMWLSLAMGFSGYGKAYLSDTRDPIGLLVLQGATGVVVLCVLACFGVVDLHPGKDVTPTAARQARLAAVLHTGQALLTNFAVLAGGVAVTNALKAMKPVAAAAFSYLLLGKTCSSSRMAALATIVAGIVILTFKGNNTGGGGGGGYVLRSAVFTMTGVCCNALRNVVIKRENPIPPHQTLLTCSAAATLVGVTLMLLRLTCRSMDNIPARGGAGHDRGDGDDLASSWLRMDGVNAALCFVGYNLASFNLLLRLSPVGHAVGNSCKDVIVSASGLLLLGEVMSIRQLGGTVVALVGVLAYNVAGTR